MNDPKETQQELFQEFSATPKKPDRFLFISRTQKPILFSTNTEQLLMGGILFIFALCGVFFLGVVRGKAIADRPLIEAPTPPPVVQVNKVVAPTPPQAVVKQVVRTQAPAQAVTIPSKPYSLQLVTHRKKEFAEAEMNALRAQGFYSFIIPSGEYFQVCAGQYASKDEAKRDLARFSSKYKDCFLRRR